MRSAIVFCLLLIVASSAAAGSWPHERDGFLIGFNVGAGTVSGEERGWGEIDGEMSAIVIRLGWAFKDQFILGVELDGAAGEASGGGDFFLTASRLALTWFPDRRGWFVRAGFGPGSAEHTIENGEIEITREVDGGALAIGGGHEWRLTRKFALGAAMDYLAIDLDDGDLDNLRFTAQFNWYF